MSDEKIIETLKETVRRVVPPDVKVILFGSRARGNAREDSDWDLLFLFEKERVSMEDFNNVVYPFFEMGTDMGAMVSPVVYARPQWEKSSFTPFYHNVMEEGVQL